MSQKKTNKSSAAKVAKKVAKVAKPVSPVKAVKAKSVKKSEVKEEVPAEMIAQNELVAILEAKKKTLELVKVAESAAKDAKMAEMQYQIVVQQVFINHNLTALDSVDDNTGEIKRGGVAVSQALAAEAQVQADAKAAVLAAALDGNMPKAKGASA